jgi:hypothetical protein
MMKVLEEGLNVCLPCGEGLDGALIDFEAERNEAEPECDKCGTAYELSSRDNRCGDCGNCSGCCDHEREGE